MTVAFAGDEHIPSPDCVLVVVDANEAGIDISMRTFGLNDSLRIACVDFSVICEWISAWKIRERGLPGISI